jgi:hypothetical protein
MFSQPELAAALPVRRTLTARRLIFAVAVTLAAAAPLAGSQTARAQTASADTVACDAASLVTAISTANSTLGGGTIDLTPGCTYVMTTANNNKYTHGKNAFPVISGSVTINGNGATIERAPWLACTSASYQTCFRFFIVVRSGTLSVNSVTFENGAAELTIPKARGGGAILNRGRLFLTHVTFLRNTALDPVANGGGAILNHDTGRLTVTQSTFLDNSGNEGGAIEDDATRKGTYATISQSTFSGNQSTIYDGGAVENVAGSRDTLTADTFVGNQAKGGAAVYAIGSMTIDDSTLTGNVGGTDGGGAIQNAGALTITRSTFSQNSAPYGSTIHTFYLGSGARPVTSLSMTIVANGQGGGDNCSGTDPITDAGYNIDTGTSCASPTNHSLTNTQPQLEALASNGGPAQTMALPSGSPAVAAVPIGTSGCGGVDQRGVARPQGPGCDIGAYETIVTTGDTQSPTMPTNLSASGVTANSVTLTWNASSDDVGVTGYTVYRDGAQVGATGGDQATAFTDTSAAPATSYSYTVDAFDGSGNHSAPSSPLPVLTLAPSGIRANQGAAGTTGSRVSSMTLSLSGAVNAGDLLVGWFGQYDAADSVQVSDSVNGAWTRSTSMTFSSGTGDIALYYLQNSAAASYGLTVTVTASSSTYLQAALGDYSGTAESGALEQVAAASGTGNQVDSGPTASVDAGALVVGGIITGTSPGSLVAGSSQGQPFAVRAVTPSGAAAVEDILGGGPGPQDATAALGSSSDWYCAVAVFYPFS